MYAVLRIVMCFRQGTRDGAGDVSRIAAAKRTKGDTVLLRQRAVAVGPRLDRSYIGSRHRR
jgi:hypothetical protein